MMTVVNSFSFFLLVYSAERETTRQRAGRLFDASSLVGPATLQTETQQPAASSQQQQTEETV
jgi:hypothetical protein